MFLASSGPLGGPLEDLLGRLGAPLDRLEAILGHLGTVLDGLGVSWSALGPSWSPLGALLLKMYVFPSEFDDMCRFCRCARRKLAIGSGVCAPPPSPGPLPRGLKPHKNVITRTSLFPLPGFARNGKSASGTCPRGLTSPFVLEPWRPELLRRRSHLEPWGGREGSHHPSYWSLGVQSSLRRRSHLEPWGAERAHITLRTGALASGALYVVVRIWGALWVVLEPFWAVLGPFWAVLGRLGGLARHG